MTQANAVSLLLGAHERTTLDFKETYDLSDLERRDQRFEMAKDIAAFANNAGGTIVVGAVENRQTRRLARFAPIDDAPTVLKTIKVACELCLPVPLADGVLLELDADAQSRLIDRSASDRRVALIAINVQPFLAGPVGVRIWSERNKGDVIDGAYRFPRRSADGTRFLRPEELAIAMNSHARRMAIRLERLDRDVNVMVWGHVPETTVSRRPYGHVCVVERIDHEEECVHLCSAQVHHPTRAVVPLTFVRALWRAEHQWHLSIDGTIFIDDGSRRSGFEPPMPGFSRS